MTAPADFAPTIQRMTIRGADCLVWKGTLDCAGVRVQLECAIRHEDMAAMRDKVWDIHEAARRGDIGALNPYIPGRHERRPRPTPRLDLLTPPEPSA